MPVLVFCGVLGKKPQNRHIFDPSPLPGSPSMRKENLKCLSAALPFYLSVQEVLSSHRKEWLVPQPPDGGHCSQVAGAVPLQACLEKETRKALLSKYFLLLS